MAAEAAAVALLLRRRKEAVDFGLAHSFPAIRIAEKIQNRVATGITESRIISRASGIEALGDELEVAASEIRGVTIAHIARDTQRANAFARNYAQQWAKKAQGDTVAKAAKAADAETLGSLKRVAVTESAEAFNDGRSRAAEEIREHTSLLKVWDAQLDKLTCPICSAADGTIVGIKESFPQGVPGAVHPWCRCTWQALTFSEHGAEGLIEPKPPAKVVSLPRAAERPNPVVEPVKAREKPTKPVRAPLPPKAPRLPKNAQLQQLVDEGFTGGIPQSGLRPESFAHLRSGGAVHGGDVTLKIRADGGVQIIDGRHRITLARERGDETIRTRILVEGSRGGIKHDVRGIDLALGQPMGVGEQRLAPAKRKKK